MVELLGLGLQNLEKKDPKVAVSRLYPIVIVQVDLRWGRLIKTYEGIVKVFLGEPLDFILEYGQQVNLLTDETIKYNLYLFVLWLHLLYRVDTKIFLEIFCVQLHALLNMFVHSSIDVLSANEDHLLYVSHHG